MKKKWTEDKLIEFEIKVLKLFEAGKINCPIHLSGGNESSLITLFESVRPCDYVFSTHRSHYHYLLKGGSKKKLLDEILGIPQGPCGGAGRSMNFCDVSVNFYTSAILSGNCAIACGVALGIKNSKKGKKEKPHVWCFLGDGAEDNGHFMEAVRFGYARRLPLTFVLEDNDFSVESTKQDRWHNYVPIQAPNVIRYEYQRRYPHVGCGRHVTL